MEKASRLILAALLSAAFILGGIGSQIRAQEGPPISLRLLGTYDTGLFDAQAAEIVAFDADTQRAFVVNGGAKTIDILDFSDPTDPSLIDQIDITVYGGGANSVDIHNGILAAAVHLLSFFFFFLSLFFPSFPSSPLFSLFLFSFPFLSFSSSFLLFFLLLLSSPLLLFSFFLFLFLPFSLLFSFFSSRLSSSLRSFFRFSSSFSSLASALLFSSLLCLTLCSFFSLSLPLPSSCLFFLPLFLPILPFSPSSFSPSRALGSLERRQLSHRQRRLSVATYRVLGERIDFGFNVSVPPPIPSSVRARPTPEPARCRRHSRSAHRPTRIS